MLHHYGESTTLRESYPRPTGKYVVTWRDSGNPGLVVWPKPGDPGQRSVWGFFLSEGYSGPGMMIKLSHIKPLSENRLSPAMHRRLSKVWVAVWKWPLDRVSRLLSFLASFFDRLSYL